MHRATPENSSFRSYVAGGGRALVLEVDDSKLMQEFKANYLYNEQAENIEGPQNYGFTSVCMDADAGQQGNITASAETAITFIGGNRTLGVAGPMDDRRHRLIKLQKGDVAMFRLKDDRQQFHMVVDPDKKYFGTYWSTRDDRINRVALVPKPQQQDQQQQGGGANATSTPTTSQGQQQQQQKYGQENCLDDNNKSPTFWEQTKDHYFIRRGNGWIIVTTDYVHIYNGSDGGGEDQLNTEPDQTNAHGSHIVINDDGLQLYNGNGHVLINNDTVETYYKDDTISTKVDAGHAHIRAGKFAMWVTKGGCHSTVRPVISQDPDI